MVKLRKDRDGYIDMCQTVTDREGKQVRLIDVLDYQRAPYTCDNTTSLRQLEKELEYAYFVPLLNTDSWPFYINAATVTEEQLEALLTMLEGNVPYLAVKLGANRVIKSYPTEGHYHMTFGLTLDEAEVRDLIDTIIDVKMSL